ncbi:hypothetical protein FIM82_06420 [Helicobacter pylori]|nr:hypothetical protein FIM82_06420 [Helicobacter pylori]
MHTSYTRYKCIGVLYYKLAAFIPNTKDIWDFCLGGLKCFEPFCISLNIRIKRNHIIIVFNPIQ